MLGDRFDGPASMFDGSTLADRPADCNADDANRFGAGSTSDGGLDDKFGDVDKLGDRFDGERS